MKGINRESLFEELEDYASEIESRIYEREDVFDDYEGCNSGIDTTLGDEPVQPSTEC